MNKLVNRLVKAFEKWRINSRRFIIVSNNCWGYEIYQTLGRQYNTPFVGLFLFPECYIRFLKNFEKCIDSSVEFTRTSKYMPGFASHNYPIGLINNDIEIHFLHYTSESEALGKWNRRVERMKIDMESKVPIFAKFCDRDGYTAEHLFRFHALPFENKLSIGINPFSSTNHVCHPKLKDHQGTFVLDGLRLYRKRYQYFDISCWILNGIVRHSAISRLLSLIS